MTETTGISALELKKQELRRKSEEYHMWKLRKIITLDEISSENPPKEKQEHSPSENHGDNTIYKKWEIVIDMIRLEVLIELTPEERASWVKLCNRLFGDIPVDKSIRMLFSSFMSEDNDFQIILRPNAIIKWIYRLLEPTENQNTPLYSRWKVQVSLYQYNGKEVEMIPSKLKVFEFLLGDQEVNYYRNNFYDFIKWQKKILEKEAKFCEDSIIKEIQKSKKLLEMSHKLNTVKLTKILDNFNNKKSVGVESKKVDTKEEKEMKKRWKERLEKWIFHLWKWDNWITINPLNYSTQWLEILLLADILECDVHSTRRFIKRLEKINKKIYLFETNKSIKIIDNTKSVSESEIDNVYRRKKWFITFEWFFEVLSYVRGL